MRLGLGGVLFCAASAYVSLMHHSKALRVLNMNNQCIASVNMDADENQVNTPRVRGNNDFLHRRPKLLLMDHQCHAKTQSVNFMHDLLSPHFDLHVHHYSRCYRIEVSNRQIREADYLIYFQYTPGRYRIFYNGTRSIFVPMYDNEWGSRWQWRRIALCGMPIISFCSRLARFARAQGVRNILDVRYFPNPASYRGMEGDPRIILLWERGQITFQSVKALFDSNDIKEVIIIRHRDEGVKRDAISPSDMRKYHVTLIDTEYLERDRYLALIRRAGTVIASRKKEGIGMAYLEAMAMKKVVVANHDATMDEYVQHGINGWLFDVDHPCKIGIQEILRLHANIPDPSAYYQRWLIDMKKIAPFVLIAPRIMYSADARRKQAMWFICFFAEALRHRAHHRLLAAGRI